jgi:hypothetical protein
MSAARTLEGIIAKLKIVAREIEPEDYPPAHGALLSALRDLDRLTSISSEPTASVS